MFLLTEHKNRLTNERVDWISYNNIARQIPGTMALLPKSARTTGPCPRRSSLPAAHDVNPAAYIAETLETIIHGHAHSGIKDLMPWRFRKTSGQPQ